MSSETDRRPALFPYVERRVAVGVENPAVAAVVALRIAGEAIRRAADLVREGRAVVVVGTMIDVVIEGAGRQDETRVALLEMGVEQQAQTVGGQGPLVEVVVAVVT